jgi:recombination protein RecA
VAEFDIDLGRGISQVGCVLDLAVEAGVVKRSGAFFAYRDERLGQGRAKAKATLEGRPELVEAIAAELGGGFSAGGWRVERGARRGLSDNG